MQTLTVSVLFAFLWVAPVCSKPKLAADLSGQGQSYGTEHNRNVLNNALKIAETYPDSAIATANNVFKVLQYGQKELKGLSFYVIGEARYAQGRMTEAQNAYQNAIELYKETDERPTLATLYNNLGLVYYLRTVFDSAMMAFSKSLEYETESNNQTGIAKSYQNIGLVHYEMGNNKKFFEYMKNALAIFEKEKDNIYIAQVSNNLAIAYVEDSDYDNAFLYYSKALDSFDKYGDKLNKANVLNNLGNLFFYKGDNTQAENYLSQALALFQTLENSQGMIHAHSRLGDVYMKRGLINEAMGHYLLCEELNKDVKLLDMQMSNLKSLSEAYRKIGDFESALRVTDKYYVLRDTVFHQEKLKTILEIEEEYLAQKQKNELLKLQAKQRITGLAVIALIVVGILIGAFIYMWVRHIKAAERQRLMALEYKVLRNQMNPHFLFSALSTIQYFVLEKKMVEAIEYLGEFSKLMRMILKYSQEEYVTLETEKKILDCYLNLQVQRFENRFSYLIHVDENVDAENVLIPPMLAQPFIENAIELGKLNSNAEGSLWLSFSIAGNRLKYRVQDNGVGQQADFSGNKKLTDHHSVAVLITKERIRLINEGEPKHPIMFETMDLTKSGKTGQLVEFSIPLHKL